MQVRKLIRLLNEMVEKDPNLAYAKVCVDKRYTENCEYTFREINDCETRVVDSWGDSLTQKEVVVLGNY